MKISRAKAIAKKEMFHILRDPFTLALALLLPLMMVTIFGIAIEFNVQNIHISVYDGDKTEASRKLVDTLGSSKYFLIDRVFDKRAAIASVDAEEDRAALIIEPQFEYHLLSDRGADAQLLLDGSDNSTVGSVISYFSTMQSLASQKITGVSVKPEVNMATRFLYNPELNSRWFVVPGLMVVVLGVLSILLTSLTVAREWENGSMELLLSTPVEPLEIIIGKLFPYVALGLGAIAFVYCVARIGFGVPFLGSHLVFLLGSALFLGTYLAQGLLISVAARNQQVSMQIAMMSGLLPSMLLSGFIFPIESRDVFLKGSSLTDLKTPFIALTIICSLMVTIATRRFKRDVEP
jgi:ABC-2 type transport system permease protein